MADVKNYINIRKEVSKLVKQLGVSQIPIRGLGDYDAANLDSIPQNKLPIVYEDLFAIYNQRRALAC